LAFKLNDEIKNRLEQEVQFKFVRSSGPGGQKVNKTSSKAELRWSAQNTQCFYGSRKERLLRKLEKQMTNEGEIIIQTDSHRDRQMNRSMCLDKLYSLVETQLFEPKKRRATKPSRSQKIKRKEQKKRQANKKKDRKKIDY